MKREWILEELRGRLIWKCIVQIVKELIEHEETGLGEQRRWGEVETDGPSGLLASRTGMLWVLWDSPLKKLDKTWNMIEENTQH